MEKADRGSGNEEVILAVEEMLDTAVRSEIVDDWARCPGVLAWDVSMMGSDDFQITATKTS